MTAIKNYPKDFIERTIELLDKLEKPAKDAKLEVTFFLNCLLGMVVSTLENLNKLDKETCDKSLFTIKLNNPEIKYLIPFKIKVIKDIELLNDYAKQFNRIEFLKNIDVDEFKIDSISVKFMKIDEIMNRDLIWFLNKIRNGIAHQNIMPTSESDEWKGIRIWNYNSKGLKDFAVEFTVSELKSFSKAIAQRYLKSLR